MPEITINDGHIVIDDVVLLIPNIKINDELSRGANGVIFKGLNPYLDRVVAVKIWLKLKEKDHRNKFEQGIKEAQKAARFGALNIYDAGNTNGFFYMVMDYLQGWITLENWLSTATPRLATRYQLANNMWRELGLLHSQEVFHGDLHLKNIMVSVSPSYEEPPIRKFAPRFVFIDFGTSYFNGQNFSKQRHWKTIEKTLDTLLTPFKIRELWTSNYPTKVGLQGFRG